MGDLLGDLAGEVTEAVYSFGYPGIFVLMVLSNLHLPIPSQLTLALAGFLVGQGRFSLVAVMGASTAGAVAASLALYFPGLWIAEEPLRRLVDSSNGLSSCSCRTSTRRMRCSSDTGARPSW